MNNKTFSDFIEAWGQMGTLWGVNRSIARVHGLLMATEGHMSLDDIASALSMSRGNASMSLKELRSWGVVHKIAVPGDRQDYYETEQDIWKMFFLIMAQRKRREFDPAIKAVRVALAASADTGEQSQVTRRFVQMQELLESMEAVVDKLLADESTSRMMIGFITGVKLQNANGDLPRKA